MEDGKKVTSVKHIVAYLSFFHILPRVDLFEVLQQFAQEKMPKLWFGDGRNSELLRLLSLLLKAPIPTNDVPMHKLTTD